MALPPVSSAMVKKLDWLGDEFVMGRIRSEVAGLGKEGVGAWNVPVNVTDDG